VPVRKILSFRLFGDPISLVGVFALTLSLALTKPPLLAQTSHSKPRVSQAKRFVTDSLNTCTTSITVPWKEGALDIGDSTLENTVNVSVDFEEDGFVTVTEQTWKTWNRPQMKYTIQESFPYVSRARLSDLSPNVTVNGYYIKVECSIGACWDVTDGPHKKLSTIADDGKQTSSTSTVEIKTDRGMEQFYPACTPELAKRTANAFSDAIRLSGGKTGRY
jgi:hypothetical protein